MSIIIIAGTTVMAASAIAASVATVRYAMMSRPNYWRIQLVWRERRERLRLGLRYAFGKLSHDEAVSVRVECYHLTGDYPLSYLSTESVLDAARERYGESIQLEKIARQACRYVWNKWNSTGHEADAADDWAWEKIFEYAAEDGLELVERENEEVGGA